MASGLAKTPGSTQAHTKAHTQVAQAFVQNLQRLIIERERGRRPKGAGEEGTTTATEITQMLKMSARMEWVKQRQWERATQLGELCTWENFCRQRNFLKIMQLEKTQNKIIY